jgi:hypothetical protein
LELNDGNLEEAISNAQEDGFFIEISGWWLLYIDIYI